MELEIPNMAALSGNMIQTDTDNNINNNEGSDSFSLSAHQMRRKLRYYFMNPWEKYKAKKRIPWKLVFQIVKIIMITVQVRINCLVTFKLVCVC